jgi:2-phospho-L-lactate guanylyltransferase (CobY/MobA/RfbA family)
MTTVNFSTRQNFALAMLVDVPFATTSFARRFLHSVNIGISLL